MSTSPIVITDKNLSDAWITALKMVIDGKRHEVGPLVISLSDFSEDLDIRLSVDANLHSHNLPKIETVAGTIFPQDLYEISNYDRQELYRKYKKNLPRIKAIDKKSNGNGTYFERLISFEGNGQDINQLETIISSLNSKKIKRRSKLQASIFDPTKDHSNKPFQGFPCLQHVTFYKSDSGGLVLNSFYAIQFLYRRAYGNWLGLIRLGEFVARETGMEFERFNCFIGVEQLDQKNLGIKEARKLFEQLTMETFSEA